MCVTWPRKDLGGGAGVTRSGRVPWDPEVLRWFLRRPGAGRHAGVQREQERRDMDGRGRVPDETNGRRLTVLHVNTQRGWRGGERQTVWLASALERLGHRSLVAARAGDELAARAAASGLQVLPLSPGFEADPRAALQLRRVIRGHEVNVVHAHAAHAVALGALATAGRRGPPLVVTRRMDIPLRSNLGTRWKYGSASAVIAISRATADALRASGIPAERVRLVHSGVDMARQVAPASRDTLVSLGIPDTVPLLVQVGQLAGDKDPVTLVRAVAHARSAVPLLHALMVGDGPLRHDVERAIEEAGLQGVVRLAGYRNDADALLAAADIVTLTSRREGLGSVLLDALALGRPVVATRAGGIPDAVFENETGFLSEPGDAAALGDAIAMLLRDRELWARMSQASLERAREFSMEAIARRTLEVYRSVLER